MKTILITGGIGSGKSEVRKRLESKGFYTYDCDSKCKALYDKIPGLKKQIESSLGVPFSEIGIIFENKDAMEKLEAIVLPLLLSDIRKWKESVNANISFIESATALEKRTLDGIYDEVWLLKAPEDIRISRNPKAKERARLQHFNERLADRIIDNSGSLEDLHIIIDNLLKEYEN